MIRIFNVYIPARTLVLLVGEIATISASFALAILIRFGPASGALFSAPQSLWKIVTIVTLALLCSHYMELYDVRRSTKPKEMFPRILMLVGVLSLILAILTYAFPVLLVGRNAFVLGLFILSMTWILWRWAYGRLIFVPVLRERVYLIGQGDRAKRIAEAIRTCRELGMDVVGWAGETENSELTRNELAEHVLEMGRRRSVDRVFVALTDRRSKMPVQELLELRMKGIKVEDGTAILEKVSGQIEIDELHPSWLLFSDGFRLAPRYWLLRSALSRFLALCFCMATLPLIPFIVILIKLDSRGPVFYRQKRVGLRNRVFECYKFRTMRSDAEADSGPTWACVNDSRVTRVGRFLRLTRLDEIPQLWNVLKGDMAFVGPRPERPEFIERLSKEVAYYDLRHVVPPGITGWAQINYKYGSSVQDSKEKLKYDLYYVKNMSLGLDLWIVFQTIRTVILTKGAQ